MMFDDASPAADPARASRAARRRRRVADADARVADGVEDVLDTGRWIHPDAAAFGDEESQGVLVVKPSVRATPAFVREIVVRAAECGYVVVEARAYSAAEVRDRGLARAHYHSHCAFAERGGLSPAERGALLRIYGTVEFERAYGRPASCVPVLPVERFLRDSGTPRRVIRRWSDASTAARGLDSGALDGPNELADDKYVNLFRHRRWTDDDPVLLINPHMPSVLAWWEESTSPRVALLLARASSDGLSWSRFRSEFCGASDGARALPGSIRRDGLDGVLEVPVEPGEVVDRTRNIVHLSNGPVEAARETALWFERPFPEQPAARRLGAAAGIPAEALMERALLAVDGTARPVNGATEGLGLQDAAELLQRGRLLDAGEVHCTLETRRRIDAAHGYVGTLRAVAPVHAVLVTASTARNRASRDSDVDLAVVTSEPVARGIERREVGELLLECEWMDVERARRVAAADDGRDLKGLRESSRLGQAVAVFDPEGLVAELAAAARAVVPPQEMVDGRLTGAIETLDELIGAQAEPGFVQWEMMRGLLDALAVVMLTLHPVRYQKPKWMIADLQDAGCEPLGELLLQAYGARGDAERGAVTVSRVRALLDRVAAEHGLPEVAAIGACGFAHEYPDWSYACRTLLDADSLSRDGAAASADYCAKFAARLALRFDNDRRAATGGGRTVIANGEEPVAKDKPATGIAGAPVSYGADYRRLFSEDPEVAPLTDADLEACSSWVDRILRTREQVFGA